MKSYKIIYLLFFLISTSIYSQEITGTWYGVLKVQSIQLKIIIHIVKSENGYDSTMDSPDQGAMRIPVTSTIFENKILKIIIPNSKIEYTGVLEKNNLIIGNFKQAGQSFPMNLLKDTQIKSN
jgi:hypothetical protein